MPTKPSTERSVISGAAVHAYQELAEALRRGVYEAGRRLPAERELAARLGVSRATLRQALTQLAEEGFLTRSAQRGWFVASPVFSEPPSVLQSFTEMARARGLTPSAQILRRTTRAATFEEAERLGCAPASPVLELQRLRGMNGVPVCLDHNVILAARAEALAEVDMTDRSLYEALRQFCDVVIERSSYSIQAAPATPEVAELLNLAPDAPVLVGQGVSYDAAGVRVMSGVTTYRGDAYRFEADLYRPLRVNVRVTPRSPQ
ncbi:MAG TPA: GntR family transcriptional regulator [Micromonospora sp.]|nr:GntR family transcriptional regulator [Micromonospora sp.]